MNRLKNPREQDKERIDKLQDYQKGLQKHSMPKPPPPRIIKEDGNFKYRIKRNSLGRFYIQEKVFFWFWRDSYVDDTTIQHIFDTESEAIECINKLKLKKRIEAEAEKNKYSNYVKYL